ncbi:hypothetical protein Q4F19_08335 [Sphingomonas sp. BIUV-7]|uniref:Metallo-beta-lactamase domain-containing protein n=1 Tax=Sphingomonas natans TaxID=3063330 RepID=A0ABT8Y7T8_9SPHN|nr:MBL fold metallo-hydrolase [Sphingomonas sp. BIUV-7]MDO6414386.1 hypothetical protein [Sphingomonas sp. BIUV-7]
MQVTLVQHGVGQGGLFCGTLTLGKKPLRWVYDCGSNQTGDLAREIGRVARGGDLDLLFLSHLDSDHVNGVDQLLSRVKVREVVLPYLSETALIATLVQDASRDRLSGVFVEAVSDLGGWFGSRGVETITFVDGSDDEGGDGPIVPRAPEDGGEGDCYSKWTTGTLPIRMEIADRLQGQGVALMQRVSPGAAQIVSSDTSALNWVLIPYVHQPSAKVMQAFNDALDAEFKTTDKMAIARTAKDPAVRAKLRNCYDALWSDHNLVSMTLYAGPIQKQALDVELWAKPHYRDGYWHPRDASKAGGWMLTGDAHLDGLRRRQRFLKFYDAYLPLINVLMLPHHGSIHNHSDEVLHAMPDLWIGFAAAGPNSYGHPHDDVRDAVQAHRRAVFHRVREKQSSQIVMEITAR